MVAQDQDEYDVVFVLMTDSSGLTNIAFVPQPSAILITKSANEFVEILKKDKIDRVVIGGVLNDDFLIWLDLMLENGLYVTMEKHANQHVYGELALILNLERLGEYKEFSYLS